MPRESVTGPERRLKEWRELRRMSQLELSLASGVSQRHISFIESGRSRPSREVLAKLASGLALPLRASNELLLMAGFAPLHAERPLEIEALQPVREALERMLAHQEPYPALVTDAPWTIVMRNRAAERILGLAADETDGAQAGPANFMRLMLGDPGMRRRIRNWPQVEAMLFGRLQREASVNPRCPSASLLAEFGAGSNGPAAFDRRSMDPVLIIELESEGQPLRLFSTFTTFAASHDVSLQELRIDMSFPADAHTRECLQRMADQAHQGPTPPGAPRR